MKTLSESAGMETLGEIRERFRRHVSDRYEHNALPCADCSTPGACCLDAHFVNVRISRLEAVAIKRKLKSLPAEKYGAVVERIDDVIVDFRLDGDSDSDADQKTYACPLYKRESGCLVHDAGKPLPCIHHACYESPEDLPPDDLLSDAELAVERLNRRVYGRSLPLLPLPIAIQKALI
jgi:hypothetical protein